MHEKFPQRVQRLEAEQKHLQVCGVGMALPVQLYSISCFLLKEQATQRTGSVITIHSQHSVSAQSVNSSEITFEPSGALS